MDISKMNGNKVTQISKHSHRGLPSRQVGYYKVMQEKPSSESANQNFATNKRLRKQKLLLQIAILGFITWGIILFLNHLIENNNTNAYQDQSTLSELIALSDLQVLEDDSAIHLPLQKDTTASTQELRLRLQNLRMHNVLRTSNSSLAVNSGYAGKADYQAQVSSTKKVSNSNLQKMLIQQWEKDFLFLKNE